MADHFLFLELIEHLKDIERRGWVIRGVPHPESVADHMYRMAVMCLVMAGYDDKTRTRAACMALVHDMGEALVGDVTPSDGMSKEEKYMREELALKYLSCTIRGTNPNSADMLLELWYEFEEGKTEAALLVRQIDKLECVHQAVMYEERTGKDMSDFMGLKEKITLPQLQPLLETCVTKYQKLQLRKKSDITIVFVTGGPGVGKGTQCGLLANEFGFHHISVGDLLRGEMENPSSPYRDFISESMRKSVVVPAQLTTQLLEKEIGKAQEQGKRSFLLDGFPRSLDQVFHFELKISKCYFTLAFECKEEELLCRLKDRSKSSGRIDDKLETSLRRVQTFNEHNKPVLEHLRKHGQVYPIDCSDPIEAVYVQVRSVVEQILDLPK